MKRMGIEALYRRPRTTKPEPGHKVYPYLAARCSDHATEPGLGDGYHLHHDVVLDWFSRRVLSWRVSITMEAAFCVETLGDALATDQERHRDLHVRQRCVARNRHQRRSSAMLEPT
jgi:putative transposase